MTRNQAETILDKYLTNKNLLNHSLATEVAMRSIYKYLYKNDYNSQAEEIWGITGLLHDADYELSKETPNQHGLLLFEKEHDIPEDISYAIKGHNPLTKVEPKTDMDWAIRAADQLTGLIVASALIHPEKKLEPLTTEFVMNRFHKKDFARGADRTSIKLCEEKLNIPLPEFISIVLEGMKSIHQEIGL